MMVVGSMRVEVGVIALQVGSVMVIGGEDSHKIDCFQP